MRRVNRVILILYSFILALLIMFLLLQILNTSWGVDYINFLQNIAGHSVRRTVAVVALVAGFFACVGTLVYALLSSRLHKSRITSNDIGDIDIGVEAIENIALNAAKAAQAGIKNAKSRVYQGKGKSVNIVMAVQLYSDVEIPAQMAKIQDRVKKDVERYTGIPVSQVKVKVNRVELVGAKVER